MNRKFKNIIKCALLFFHIGIILLLFLFIWQNVFALNKDKKLLIENQVGVVESPQNSNRGKEIDAYNKYAGVPLGSSWCASLQMYSFDTRKDSLLKRIASAGTQNWWRNARARGLTTDKPQENSGVIGYKSNSSGHIGYIIKVYADGSFDCIEGNTSPNSKGNQREGDGCYIKRRKGNISKTLKLRGYIKCRQE